VGTLWKSMVLFASVNREGAQPGREWENWGVQLQKGTQKVKLLLIEAVGWSWVKEQVVVRGGGGEGKGWGDPRRSGAESRTRWLKNERSVVASRRAQRRREERGLKVVAK